MMPKLYMTEVSPGVRAVLMTAKVLNVTLDLKEVNLENKEQLSPKFLKVSTFIRKCFIEFFTKSRL